MKRDPLGLKEALDLRRTRSTIRQLTTSPPDSVDFSSNDFLSLSSSWDLRQAFLKELQDESKITKLGSSGSRLLDGNSAYAEELEQDIAAFHNAPAGLLFNSGFDANASILSCLPQPGDTVIFDELIHASIHEGMKLSRAAQFISFAHNDIGSFHVVLDQCLSNDAALKAGQRSVFVAVEAVYSMDGDVAPLHDIATLLSSALPKGNGHLIVDEAHSTGVLGTRGRGLVCELGLEDQVTVRLHTFGKALACSGAIVLCSPLIREYFINYARNFIYTTFMSYSSLAAIRSAYTLLEEGKIERLLHQLQIVIGLLHERLLRLEASLRLSPDTNHLLRIPEVRSRSAISYVMSSQPKSLAMYCRSKGYVVRAIMPPTVPAGTERIRICLHAENTTGQVLGLVDTIKAWVQHQNSLAIFDSPSPKL